MFLSKTETETQVTSISLTVFRTTQAHYKGTDIPQRSASAAPRKSAQGGIKERANCQLYIHRDKPAQLKSELHHTET